VNDADLTIPDKSVVPEGHADTDRYEELRKFIERDARQRFGTEGRQFVDVRLVK
jgi:hypothetical protein